MKLSPNNQWINDFVKGRANRISSSLD